MYISILHYLCGRKQMESFRSPPFFSSLFFLYGVLGKGSRLRLRERELLLTLARITRATVRLSYPGESCMWRRHCFSSLMCVLRIMLGLSSPWKVNRDRPSRLRVIPPSLGMEHHRVLPHSPPSSAIHFPHASPSSSPLLGSFTQNSTVHASAAKSVLPLLPVSSVGIHMGKQVTRQSTKGHGALSCRMASGTRGQHIGIKGHCYIMQHEQVTCLSSLGQRNPMPCRSKHV
ncbi:hypothetical protein J3F83DRAFT_495451 [Trichoderma novae-zelandiae]